MSQRLRDCERLDCAIIGQLRHNGSNNAVSGWSFSCVEKGPPFAFWDSMIEIVDLVYEYPSMRALDGVSLRVPEKTIAALVGPNGAGKTTLLRCMAALERPYSGTVTIDGLDSRESPRELHARLGYLPDFFGLYDDLTVRRCLAYAAAAHGLAPALESGAVEMAARRVGLIDRLETKAGELSRGLRQRLAIAQAIVHSPKVLLLDEPAAGLDPQARRDLSSLLVNLRDQGMTLVVSSHILAELEDYCSEMLILDGGRLVGGHAVKVRDVEKPRYIVELATARSDLGEFLATAGVDVLEADGHNALINFTRNAGARAKLIRDLLAAGFDVASFGESSRGLEDAYFSQVSTNATAPIAAQEKTQANYEGVA